MSADFELLTTDELSALIRVPYKSLERWRAVGKGPRYARLGKRIMYRRQDVQDWLTCAFESA